jgi:hypothetical protein
LCSSLIQPIHRLGVPDAPCLHHVYNYKGFPKADARVEA